jgi:hypothetical protein
MAMKLAPMMTARAPAFARAAIARASAIERRVKTLSLSRGLKAVGLGARRDQKTIEGNIYAREAVDGPIARVDAGNLCRKPKVDAVLGKPVIAT